MAGDSLRASAPTAAPSEGATLPPSFAFRQFPDRGGHGGYYAEADEPASGRFFSISGAPRGKVHLYHGTAGMSGTLELRPEQARALAFELLRAANAVQPCEDACLADGLPCGTKPEHPALTLELLAALRLARRWIGDGDLSDGLHREHWTPEYAAAVDTVDAVLARAARVPAASATNVQGV